jgi:hypothetical protein
MFVSSYAFHPSVNLQYVNSSMFKTQMKIFFHPHRSSYFSISTGKKTGRASFLSLWVAVAFIQGTIFKIFRMPYGKNLL